jgi:hypothetical protein
VRRRAERRCFAPPSRVLRGSITEGNYSSANWTILTGFKTDGDTAIDAATDVAGVTDALNAATDGMAGVQTLAVPTPTFTDLTASPSVTYGATSIALSLPGRSFSAKAGLPIATAGRVRDR